MPRALDLKGRRFGRLTVIGFSHKRGHNAYYKCHCECGGIKFNQKSDLLSGKTKSCGCLLREATRARSTTHGKSKTQAYRRWTNMFDRCENHKTMSYKFYGGRGIKVCKRWSRFENFFLDMGDVPDGMSLERINNNKNYSPSNCIWANKITQANNTRANIIINFLGEKFTAKQASVLFGINYQTLVSRIKAKWSHDRALLEY